jgi:hypothetical protein
VIDCRSMLVISGRVRATVRLKSDGVPATCVVSTSWSSDRPFPRTLGTGVVFDVETAEGEVFAVDPFDALVVLPVRRRGSRDGVRLEEGWLAHGDTVDVAGELRPGRGRVLRASRIALGAAPGSHRVPPRSLVRGELEKVELAKKPTQAAPVLVEGAPAPDPVLSPVLTPEPAPAPEATEEAPKAEASTAAEDGQPARRPKKRRPDSSGTPTPIQ